jgi:3-oxoacyl-[acyl-carrier protein] reductase
MRRAIALGAALLGSIGVAVVALEIALRLLGATAPPDPPSGLYLPDSELGHFHAPGVDTVQSGPDFEVRVQTSTSGLRDPERGPRRLGVFRILSLGDSYAFGYGVEAAETYAAVLERELGPVRFEVINAGVSGYGTITETRLLERLVPRLAPDLALVAFFTGNDLINNLRASGRMRPALEDSSLAWLGRRSRLLSFAWSRVENLELKLRSAETVEITRAALDQLIDTCRGRALPLAVLLITPSPQSLERFDRRAALRRVLDASLGFDPREQIEAVRAHLTARGVPVLDSYALLDGDPDPGSLELPESEHWTPRAHALVGRALARFLRERALVPGASVEPPDGGTLRGQEDAMGRLDGKLALVTGGARGIGAAIARRFREEGAAVVINDLRAESAEKTAAELGAEALAADVSDSSAVERMFREVDRRHGRLDVLVNNAGISGLEEDPVRAEQFRQRAMQQAAELAAGGPVRTHNDRTVELTDQEWRRMLGVHLDGTFYCTREALRIMNRGQGGAIINMGSIMGTAGGAGAPHYCAAKAGILGLTRALARELATRGIRVNAIAPGWIDTEMTAPLLDYRQMIAMQTPLGRFGEVDDIAWAAVYLASDEAKFVTGQVLSPNGGWHMSQ